MKAIVYRGPRVMELEEVEQPQPQAGEALIQVDAVGICGSELEGYLGHSSVRVPPLIMGHEFCGTTAALPDDYAGAVSVGDKVIVNPLIACGACDRCLRGKPNICSRRQIIGIHRPGAFADYVSVPVANMHPVPHDMDPGLGSLAEPLAVSIHALQLGYMPDEPLLIFGAGPIGLLTLQAAKAMGAERVLVMDRQPHRLAFAERFGAATSAPEQVEERMRTVFGSDTIDTIIDCVGVDATRKQAMHLIQSGGTIVMVGLGSDDSTLPINHLVRQEISIRGSYTYDSNEFEQAVGLLLSGQISMDDWSVERSLSDAPTSFRELVDSAIPYSKVILRP